MKIKLISASVLLVVAISVFCLFKFQYAIKPKTGQEYSLVSVMITRYDGRSGGSGVVISSNKNSSQILTNAHVCDVIKNGGIVRSDYSKGIVKNYKISNLHDLCLITTNNNFKVNTILAQESPEVYTDASVVGHPHLLSTIVTKGHFSQKEIITILVGTRPCNIEDVTNDKTAIYCQFFGMIPIIKTYEAQVVSSTIMPGSSGSPVFNANGELAGLVFAGSGEFGYAHIVPFEYISTFFEYELKDLPVMIPNDTNVESEKSEQIKKITKTCSSSIPSQIKHICDMVSKSLLLIN